MASTSVFALPTSDLNGFLFADIGTEDNGSSLTVLSALARLGQDPWAQAANWASMSKDAAIVALTACIAQMPLSPKDLQNAPATATRLIALLFRQHSALGVVSKIGSAPSRMNFAPIRILYVVIGVGLAVALASFVGSHTQIGQWWKASQTSPSN